MTEIEYYLHTLEGRPAFFDGRQICYGMWGGYHRNAQRLAKNLKQIRDEQDASRKWREKRGFKDHYTHYNYVRVRLP